MSEQISLGELIPQMEAQASRMSVKNPARRLLWIAAQILIQQGNEIMHWREQAAKQEQPKIAMEPSRIVIP